MPLAEYNYYNTGLIASKFYAVLGERDMDGFKQAVWNSVLIVVSTCIVSREHVSVPCVASEP